MRENAQLIDLRKIWDQAPHNVLTDLIRFGKTWFCVFREGSSHKSPDGRIRILSSRVGLTWKAAALLSCPGADLRDPKFTITPEGRLMLNACAAYESGPVRHQSLAWFSHDGRTWSAPRKIGDPNFWLWHFCWNEGIAYSVAYSTVEPAIVRLYRSRNGIFFETAVSRMFDECLPNETSLIFRGKDSALCLLRRDGGRATAQLGSAHPPYREWQWKDLGVRIGGPRLLGLPDDRYVAAIRRYGQEPWTSLNWLDPVEGKLVKFLVLPSGGDTSYAGLCWHENILWVSSYSSHE
jgi:hypothetical protein